MSAGVPSVKGVIGGIPLPWAVPAADGFPKITNLGGNKWAYVMKFSVSSTYPSIRSQVTWKVVDPNDEAIFCFRIAVALASRN